MYSEYKSITLSLSLKSLYKTIEASLLAFFSDEFFSLIVYLLFVLCFHLFVFLLYLPLISL